MTALDSNTAREGSAMLAGIPYVGISGSTHDCLQAIVCLLQYRTSIAKVRIVTHDQRHCLLLTTLDGDKIGVKAGFSSGYAGTGPYWFSKALSLLHQVGAELDEIEVTAGLLEQADRGVLTEDNLELLISSAPVQPTRLWDYMNSDDYMVQEPGRNWRSCCKPVIPFAIVDDRIFDLAIDFWNDPDKCLMTGYRRLEGILRTRTGSSEVSTRLIRVAFQGNNPKLMWSDGEQEGRALIFAGAFMAHRNDRAHKEKVQDEHQTLREFLLLNELFYLEGLALPAGHP